MTTLFVSDLDGTLLNRAGELSAGSRAGVLTLLERGTSFTVASARSLTSMRDLLGPLPLRLPVACLNGGTISDFATGRHLQVHSIPAGVAAGVLQLADARGLPMMVGTHSSRGERVWVPQAHDAGMAAYVEDRRVRGDPRVRCVPDVSVGLEGEVTSLTVIARREPAEALARDVGAGFLAHLDLTVFDDFYTPGWVWMTAHAARANKGDAVRTLVADHATRTSRLVVFGDQVNDVPMFEAADYAVATANAVPQLRELADEVIGHHDEDAVVRWLLHHA